MGQHRTGRSSMAERSVGQNCELEGGLVGWVEGAFNEADKTP